MSSEFDRGLALAALRGADAVAKLADGNRSSVIAVCLAAGCSATDMREALGIEENGMPSARAGLMVQIADEEAEGYVQVSVLVGGALVEERDLPPEEVAEYRRQVGRQAVRVGLHTEVFLIPHPHPATEEECACVQFLQDHHPADVWNAPEPVQ